MIEALGSRWRPLRLHREGVANALENSLGVVRITRGNGVGEVLYNSRFDPTIPVDELRMLMSLDDVRLVLPEIEIGELIGLMKGVPPRFSAREE